MVANGEPQAAAAGWLAYHGTRNSSTRPPSPHSLDRCPAIDAGS